MYFVVGDEDVRAVEVGEAELLERVIGGHHVPRLSPRVS